MTTSTTSLARLFRQLMYVSMIQSRWLNKAVKARWSDDIAQAEIGHAGEICVIVENHLPISSAYHQDCAERAIDLFALHRVWDTEYNTGVLIYLNLCEHQLQIVADRGINQAVGEQTWQALCDQALTQCRAGDMPSAISRLIHQVGGLLATHQPSDDVMGNELLNRVTFIR